MKDQFTKQWIIETGTPIVQSYGGNITLRALHYRLVAAHGMTNTIRHYRRVVDAMTTARWGGIVAFDDFLDHDRETLGRTAFEQTNLDDKVDEAQAQIEAWMTSYRKNRWENQPTYIEVFIEKKALQGVFQSPCRSKSIALNPCKGYPSLTYLHDACMRLQRAHDDGKSVVILYYGDHDPSGDDIPRSIVDNLRRMGLQDFELKRMLLTREQVVEWNLPPAPTKMTDSRAQSWDGVGQVELDAIEPHELARMVTQHIDDEFDKQLYVELIDQESIEREEFQSQLKEFVQSL